MFVGIVILSFFCILLGMFISVKAFGTGVKRAKCFDDIYFDVENVDGMGVVYTKGGDYSAILFMNNPVKKYSADTDSYYDFNNTMTSVIQSLGDNYAIHKQDIFVRRKFNMAEVLGKDAAKKRNFLSEAYFRFFNGRLYTSSESYLVITQKGKAGGLHTYDAGQWKDFLVKCQKVMDRLKNDQIVCHWLKADECRNYCERYYAMDFVHRNFSMTDFKVSNEMIGMGDHRMKVFSLLDVDDVGLPGLLRPYADVTVNNAVMSEDLLSGIDHIPDAETVVYNQVIFIPNQRHEKAKLEKKRNRAASIPNPNNQIIVEDINKVLDDIARNGRLMVYAHYNLLVSIRSDKDMQKVTNAIENILARSYIHPSKRAYNQLELYIGSFPGNCFKLSEDYDRFLTLSEPAMCLMYKERQSRGDDSTFKAWYTDRQGLPLPVDLTGKEGKIKYTNNSNFFVLGPSGSGKSFFMNTFMRQSYEQDTDCVIVDTGDSYEGLCSYFGGTYISYSKEHPISMNPFKITETEYAQNFEEKKNFLKSLVFLIFKGSQPYSKLEDVIIDQTIIEYYQEYFHPFKGFTDEEREVMRDTLRLEDKKNGKYDEYEEKIIESYGDLTSLKDLDEIKFVAGGDPETERGKRLISKLQAILDDSASEEGEKANAARCIRLLRGEEAPREGQNLPMLITPAVIENHYHQDIEQRLDRIEWQKKKLKVSELSFNSYYEFAIERIPQIMRNDHVEFDIDNFAKILKQFYRGNPYENTLNNDMDQSLFDEKFIVFEIDKVKDDPKLFPIIVLIIMDVFTQKMRIKKNRKCLVIEEAWKAIATPVMANYIKYLYKTARKHWAMVGVVTQEIQDITGSDIVKDAIINNSDVFMLLDQSKFKDKFDDIKATLALTENDCKKIFTINRLDNHEGRSSFKEVFIKRGTEGEVYGVEEPPECYINYTTEKVEKEALKLYKHELGGTQQEAITAFVRDWQISGLNCTSFARKVMKEGRILNLRPAER